MMLIKKAIRAMWGNKRAYIACIWLLSVGVMFYVAMNITSTDVFTSRDTYYRDYRLADVFADVTAAGATAADRLVRIPGVADADVRRVEDCRVVLPGSDKIITLRVISYNPGAAAPINGASLSGAFRADNDLFVAQSFLDAHRLATGDSLDLLLGGRQVRFNIAGVASTPEYTYTIPSRAEFMPDPAKFNFAFALEKPLNNYFGTPNIYNSIGIMLDEGVKFDDVSDPIRDELRKYGLTNLYSQEEQPSAEVVDTELSAITSISSILPVVFFGLAAVILYLMLKRVVEQDRAQIGTLKAFGFGSAQIVWHYMFYGLSTGGLGALLGAVSGYMISGFLSGMMRMFFNLPEARSNIDMVPILATGLLAGIASGGLGAFMGAWRVIRLQPAEAMKPEAPRVTKHDPLHFLPGIRLMLTSMGSMAVRNITRAKFRSLFIVASIGASYATLVFFSSYPNMIDNMMLNQYTKSEVYDIKVTFRSPRDAFAAVDELRRLGGVRGAEALLEVPAQLLYNDNTAGATLSGISAGSTMYKIYDERKQNTCPLPTQGLLISESTAEKLGAGVGDKLTVRSPYLDEDIKLAVAGLMNKSIGGAYIEREALAAAMRLGGQATSVILEADDISYVKEALKEGSNIASIVDSAEAIEGFQLYLGMMRSMLSVYFFYGVAISFAIIYNTSTISYSERRREFATLKVLGMTVPEISSIQAFEYWTLTGFGILLGMPLTTMIKQALNSMIDMEAFVIPTYTFPREHLFGVLGVVLAVLISNRVSRRKIIKLDMVESLKDKE